MILFFSGTGNSRYIAELLANYLHEPVVDLNTRLRQQDRSEIYSETPWIVVAPTYSWQMPHVVKNYLTEVKLSGNRKIYFVQTYGTAIGSTVSDTQALAQTLGMEFMGMAAIHMPENYIAMFPIPEEKQCLQLIHDAESQIEVIARAIGSVQPLHTPKVSRMQQAVGNIVNRCFYQFIVSDKKFFATDRCVSCGFCESLCPLCNIQIKDGKPVWNGNCTNCMACICGCPKEAIEYGKKTSGKTRYLCMKYSD